MSEPLSAFYLPSLPVETATQIFNGCSLAVPRLEARQVESAIRFLKEQAAVHLHTRSDESIVNSLVETASLWLADESNHMTTALELLPSVTGYSRPVIAHQLQHLFTQMTHERLQQLLPGNHHPSPVTRHQPSVTHFCAGNIPGLAIEPIIFSLLAGIPAFIKVSSDEPLLAPLFARSFEVVDPELAGCLAIACWRGGDAELERAACELAEVVVATGDDEAVNAVRSLTPASARFIGHPHKMSVGLVARDSLDATTAAAIAKDVALFDQQGCLSPQVVYIETGTDEPIPVRILRTGSDSSNAVRFARLLLEALEEAGKEFPMGTLSASGAGHVQQVCATLELSGATVWKTAGAPFRVVVLDGGEGRSFRPISVRGGVTLRPVVSLSAADEFLRPFNGKLQAVGVATSEPELATLSPLLHALGVSRICPLGELQTPPLGWHADGIDPVGSLRG